ncbi:MAG TPA: AI-2E family transporter [Rhodocyclaceae bacterium]|nr:AI-2E family transporter [Rhodocyclaceae bacterium]
MPTDHRLQTALWISLGLFSLWLLYLLGPILAPFLLAGILAYVCNPLVDRLQRLGLPRVLAVLVVLLLLLALMAGLVLILAPLLAEEAAVLAARLPDALALANEKLTPWLRANFGIRLRFDPASLKKLATENMDSVQTIAQHLYQSLKIGGVALLGVLINLLLAPVAMFYLLLDWHPLLGRLENAIPRAWHGKTVGMARDVDTVLSQFLRGQLLVMLVLAVYYSGALWLAGLPSAIAIGLLTGFLIFVPYLGFATGFALALLVAALQFEGLGPVAAVLMIFGIGQLLEGFLLTPFLVGERIGLHPLAVIFALMAFGQLFGFFGILLALPASAALLVGLRELRAVYLRSRFYRGAAE